MRFCLLLLLQLLFVSCNREETRAVEMIKEWLGREIVYPNNMVFTIQGVDTLPTFYSGKYSYVIMNYVDSTGCTSCKLQLPRWQSFIKEVDSISNGHVDIHLVLHPKYRQEVINMLKVNRYQYPVCIDEKDSLNKLNHFPSEMAFQTFLLDKDNKVLAIGNPIHNPKVKELYLKIIRGEQVGSEDKSKQIMTQIAVDRTSASLGSFDWQEEQKVTFTLKNTGNKLLVVQDITTSCGCTTVSYSKEPVQPGGEIPIEVSYKAERPGYFHKTVTVYCNAENSLLTLKINGNAQ